MSSNSLRPGWNRQGFQPPPPADNTFETATTQQQSERRTGGPPMKGRSLADLARGNPQQRPVKANAATPKAPRYTREKVLSLRPVNSEPPEAILALIEEIKTPEAQDPVCWDTFDADEIWNANAKLRKAERPARRENSGSFGSSRWQRGVALPAPDKRTSSKDAETPDELWDDPQSNEANTNDADVFDFEQMAENSRKLEEEMRGGSRSRSSSTDEQAADSTVDPKRPLAAAGTTIRSGSGEDVNVFEDFDEPVAPPPVVRAANEDQNASSRLMAMIGVQKDPAAPVVATQGSNEDQATTDSSAKFISLPATTEDTENKTPPVESSLSWGLPGSSDTATSIPLNPWGGLGAALPLQTQLAEQQRLDEEKKRAALEEQERLRRREQERLMKEQQQREAQVELVLMERISNILEASWGRSDLRSILSTLHAEDARVMSLLNSVDALRALLFRHPRRIALRPDPSLGAEIAILLMTNTQWRANEQDPPARPIPKTDELPPVNPTQPWFYSDPSKNIQGPFRGEEMRQWLEAGYFKGDLPISQNPKGPFMSLSLFFPNLPEAFKTSDEEAEAAERNREAGLQQLKLEKQREAEWREAELREHERKESERREMERRQAELREAQMQAANAPLVEPRKAQNGGDSASAAKLKLMLGLGGESAATEVKSSEPSSTAAKPESHPQGSSSSKPSKPAKVAPSNATPQQQEKPAWGGAAKPAARKSMSEIQQEEARAAAESALHRPSGSSGNNGWANVAAARSTSGMTAPSLNASWNAKQQQQSRPVASGVPSTSSSRQPTRAMSMQTQGAQRKPTVRSQSVSESTPTEAFGAKMSPALEQWAKDQMKRINGTDDLTLVAFCMTLEDSEEIRQYLSAYLGANNAVNAFATEFIARKNDDWESTARKGRKKKNSNR